MSLGEAIFWALIIILLIFLLKIGLKIIIVIIAIIAIYYLVKWITTPSKTYVVERYGSLNPSNSLNTQANMPNDWHDNIRQYYQEKYNGKNVYSHLSIPKVSPKCANEQIQRGNLDLGEIINVCTIPNESIGNSY